MMYIEEAIERLEQMRELYDSGEMAEALDMAIDALSRKWTPVTEGLPTEDGEYLVTTINDCGTRRRQVSSFVLFNGGMCYSWGIETSPVYKVLAWTNLPEIYQD